jgi:hypothetical protein
MSANRDLDYKFSRDSPPEERRPFAHAAAQAWGANRMPEERAEVTSGVTPPLVRSLITVYWPAKTFPSDPADGVLDVAMLRHRVRRLSEVPTRQPSLSPRPLLAGLVPFGSRKLKLFETRSFVADRKPSQCPRDE